MLTVREYHVMLNLIQHPPSAKGWTLKRVQGGVLPHVVLMKSELLLG